MKRTQSVWLGLFLLAFALPAQAQVGVNTALLFEKYSFGSGLDYSEVSELTLPFTLSAGLGGRGTLTVSGGLTRVKLVGPSLDPHGIDEKEISGLVDTEARLVVDLVPDRLSMLLTAVAPTGMKALEVEEGAVLTALSSQVIGFSTMSLGSGGRAGAGFAGALPLGGMALGIAGTYTHSLAYNPVVGQDAEWKPGGEIRFRAGLEGNAGPGTYLRVAAIFASRQADLIDGEEYGQTGRQLHGYAALNRKVGSGSFTVYAMDSYRSAPQVEATGVGAVLLPKGNLLSLGARADIPVAGEATLIPLVELRRLSEAPRGDAAGGALEAAGSTLRAGANLRFPVRRGVALVVEGNGLFGTVGKGDGATADVSGFRGGLHLEIRR